MTTFSTSMVNPEAAGGNATRIQQTVQAAADVWARYIQGVGSIEISVTIADIGGRIAEAGSQYEWLDGLYSPRPVIEIQTGVDTNASATDIYMRISPNWVNQLFYDPSYTQSVPGNLTDGMSVFLHEIGHGLGYTYLSPSLFSGYVQTVSGQTVFTGPNARLDYGGNVPMDSEGIHIDIRSDLMYPSFAPGERKYVSALDVALLQDIGIPLGTNRADLISLKSLNDRFYAFDGNDTVQGGAGADIIYGNLGADVLFGNTGADVVFGGQGSDSLYGGQDGDVVYGNLGDDAIYGNLGDDRLFGGQGNDLLFGGQGNDVFFGNLGADTLYGNLGADRFVFGLNSGADLIVGMDRNAGDRIDVQSQSVSIATDPNGWARLDLSGGGSVTIVGIRESEINETYFA